MENGDIQLHYNYEVDELFFIKRGVLFGKYLLESYDGTSLFNTMEELEKSTSLTGNSIYIDEIE